ncbi:serine/threonine-protein kinase [Prosthecobacter sp. SYSU 5D2]|uniref:WD40 repeat domain-containing serine/threonine protein kinase n=1 Tax=Prosthecobacter sp. SYSU 5D2 TaxID=3134134 RepID=UPI0031FED3C9
MMDDIPTKPMPRPVSCPDCGRPMPLEGPVWLCPACLAANFFGSEGAEPLSMDEPMREEGEMVGRYRLIEPIGEGGFGIVYRAEQTLPFQRQVALKLIKPGLDSRMVVARFEAERQALSMLDHPNIARALDAGTTEDGRPFFVMELVDGLPVNLFCTKHRLKLDERLHLFLDICAGMEHAHAKGVIHRDLKPSNVMVAAGQDGGPPKVTIIDFGIAKALWQELTPHTLYTHPRQMLGTPEYMSPEQALHGGLNIDTRADVYSLGALLYEMITGHAPLSGAQLAQVGLDEWVKAIRDHNPMRPSRRLATLGADAQELQLLTARTENELDWVVLKALAKERERRYQTVREFGEDVRRFLLDEAVSARPPSLGYLTRKFVRRHRGQVLAAAVALAVLIVGSLVSFGMAMRAEKAEKRTRQVFSESDTAASQEKANNKKYGEAVALLCRALRTDPQNQEAMFRLMVLLSEAPAGVMENPALRHNESVWQGGFVPPEGRQILTASVRNGTLKLWDWKRGSAETVRNFVQPDALSAFALSADGQWVASASSSDGGSQVSVWGVKNGKLRGRPLLMPTVSGSRPPLNFQVTAMGFSPDGDLLYTASTDRMIRAWQVSKSALLWEVRCPAVPASVAVSSDETRIAVGFEDTRMGLYDARTGEMVFEAPVQRHAPTGGVVFTPDGKKVMVTGGDTFSPVFDSQTGQRHGNLEHHDRLYALALSPDGERVATGGRDGYVRLRTLKGGFIHAERMPDIVRALAFSADGEMLAVGTQEPNATVSLLDGRTGATLGAPLQMHRVVTGLSFHPDGEHLLVTCHSENVAVIDIRSRKLLPKVVRCGEPLLHGGLRADGKGVYALTESGRLLRLDWQGRAEAPLVQAGGAPATYEIAETAGAYAVMTRGTRIWVADLDAWKLNYERTLPSSVTRLAVRPECGEVLILDGARRNLSVLSLKTGEVKHELKPDAGIVTAIAFSQDGRIVVTGHEGGMLMFYDLEKGTERKVQSRSRSDVLNLSLDAAGTRAVSGSQDALMYVWDVATGEEQPKARMRTPRHSDSAMAGGIKTVYARDGESFFSYNSRDLRVRSFSADTGQLDGPYLTHVSPVSHIAESPEGKLLLTAEVEGRISLWHLDKSLPATCGYTLDSAIVNVGFGKDGRHALAVQKKGEIHVWNLPPTDGHPLPDCFLRFAEGFGGWRLTSENVLQMMSYEVFDDARSEVLALPDDDQDLQRAWMKWLASDPDERAQWPE